MVSQTAVYFSSSTKQMILTQVDDGDMFSGKVYFLRNKSDNGLVALRHS